MAYTPLVQRVGGRTSILRSQPLKIPAVNHIPSATRLIKIGLVADHIFFVLLSLEVRSHVSGKCFHIDSILRVL